MRDTTAVLVAIGVTVPLAALLIDVAALAWTVGDMGPVQYWITPEDLAARRFENTVLTIAAY